jgi:hypothetical protein
MTSIELETAGLLPTGVERDPGTYGTKAASRASELRRLVEQEQALRPTGD